MLTPPPQQFVWEPVPGPDASLGQYLAAGSHHPLPLPALLNPLRRASASEYIEFWHL